MSLSENLRQGVVAHALTVPSAPTVGTPVVLDTNVILDLILERPPSRPHS